MSAQTLFAWDQFIVDDRSALTDAYQVLDITRQPIAVVEPDKVKTWRRFSKVMEFFWDILVGSSADSFTLRIRDANGVLVAIVLGDYQDQSVKANVYDDRDVAIAVIEQRGIRFMINRRAGGQIAEIIGYSKDSGFRIVDADGCQLGTISGLSEDGEEDGSDIANQYLVSLTSDSAWDSDRVAVVAAAITIGRMLRGAEPDGSGLLDLAGLIPWT